MSLRQLNNSRMRERNVYCNCFFVVSICVCLCVSVCVHVVGACVHVRVVCACACACAVYDYVRLLLQTLCALHDLMSLVATGWEVQCPMYYCNEFLIAYFNSSLHNLLKYMARDIHSHTVTQLHLNSVEEV